MLIPISSSELPVVPPSLLLFLSTLLAIVSILSSFVREGGVNRLFPPKDFRAKFLQ